MKNRYLLIVFGLIILSGCLRPEEKFHKKQLVRMRVDGRQVLVTDTSCAQQDVATREQLQPCQYLVKYAVKGYVPPYSSMWVQEFELEAIVVDTVGSCTVENGEGILVEFPCELIK